MEMKYKLQKGREKKRETGKKIVPLKQQTVLNAVSNVINLGLSLPERFVPKHGDKIMKPKYVHLISFDPQTSHVDLSTLTLFPKVKSPPK